MLEEDDEGEYLDDPISLIYDGVADVIDLATSSDEDEEAPVPRSSYGVKSFSLPVTFFDISRNVKLLKECQPLSIKVVDCNKYPMKKPNCKAKSQVSCDKNKPSCDDHKLMKHAKETMSVNVGLNSEVNSDQANAETNLDPIQKAYCGSRMEEADRESKEATQKNDTTGSKKVEQEKQQALKRKDLSRVDFKKNTGLVGLTITSKLGMKMDIHNRRSKKEKVGKEIMKDIGATLNNLGTEVIPLLNSNISDVPKNVINDSQSIIPPKEASSESPDAKSQIAKNKDNSPTRCSLKIKCSKLLEKAIKLKKIAKESHSQEPAKTKSELNSKQNTLDIIANDHTVPKLNLKRRPSEADRNVFYIVDSNNKGSGCGTKNKTRKLAETKEEDKVSKNQADKDIPPRSSSPILQCTTNINTSNQGKLKPSTKLTKMPNHNRKETCALAPKPGTKSYQKKLQSYVLYKNTPYKKKNQNKTPILDPIPEFLSVPVNNKTDSSGGSTNVAPKPDELARIRRDKQLKLTKINSNNILQHAESLPAAANGFCVRTHQQSPKTKVTKPSDAAIGTSENLTGVDNDSYVRIYQHTHKNKATTPSEAAVPNENRFTNRDPMAKVPHLTHKQRDTGAALNFSQSVNDTSLAGENNRRVEWRQALFNTQPDLNKTENYPTSNRAFNSNYIGNLKESQPSPLQTSMHEIQGRPIETMINGRPHLYKQPEPNALQGRPVRFLSPWPPFPPPNTNIALNALPRILRPNSQTCRMPYANTPNYQIPGHWWPITPGNRFLPPLPTPLPPQQESGSSVTPVRQVSKESVIGSNADGNPIKKIVLTNAINDKEKMLQTLNSAIDENLDKVTEKKQEPMRMQTDPRLAAKSKPCPLSKKANNNSFQPNIDQKARDIPTSKTYSPCNFPVSSYRQAIAMAMNEKSCPLSKKPMNSVQTKIDLKVAPIPSYSPPILPIPSYQQAFEIIAKSEKHKMHKIFKEFKTLPNHSKIYSKIITKKGPREDQAKKISIEEYKKRLKKDGVDKNNSTKRKCKNKNVPIKVALDNNQDLGYDSDATLVL